MELKLKFDFTIGADPEFTCRSRGRAIHADNFFVALDRRRGSGDGTEPNVITDERFGMDGSGRPFEVRPAPSTDPLEVVENISAIFRGAVAADRRLLGYQWKAGSADGQEPLGGHIHFGTKPGGVQLMEDKDVAHLLDTYLGSLLVLIEGQAGARRRRCGYGGAGDFRNQHYGVEYRTPGSWLVSPYVAAACLCLGKAVVAEALNFNHDSLIADDHAGFAGMIDSYDVFGLRDVFPKIWDSITRLGLYQEYKPYIDVLYFLVKNQLTWQPRVGMKAAWGIEDIRLPMPRSMRMDTIWSRYRQEVCHG